MNTLKGIGLFLALCALGVGYFCFIAIGMLCLAIRDGFVAVGQGTARRLRGERYLRHQPRTFVAGQDGVPHLVMDADGVVEPPATQPRLSVVPAVQSPAPLAGVDTPFCGTSHRSSFRGVNMGHVNQPVGGTSGQTRPIRTGVPHLSLVPPVIRTVVPFPATAEEKARLIAGRRGPVFVPSSNGVRVVDLGTYRRTAQKRR